MVAILTLFCVITISILVTRIATVALTLTGLPREMARFQARSAFTGSGFTTRESEEVVNHPVRRRIVMLLMLVGNAGLVTVISTLILTFMNVGGLRGVGVLRGVVLVVGLALLAALSASQWVDRHLNRLIDGVLRRYTKLELKDVGSLMRLHGDYQLVELLVQADDWAAGRTLLELELRDEGIIVLGIRRKDGSYVGAPNGDSCVFADDILLVYGRGTAIERLDKRRSTWMAEARHDHAVLEERRIQDKERSISEGLVESEADES